MHVHLGYRLRSLGIRSKDHAALRDSVTTSIDSDSEQLQVMSSGSGGARIRAPPASSRRRLAIDRS